MKYYCNKCEKEYDGAPAVEYENPNEELGEGVTLLEKGQYKCKMCSSTLAQYRKFDAPAQQQNPTPVPKAEQAAAILDITAIPVAATTSSENFVTLQSLVGMAAYDSEAMLIGKVEEVGLQRGGGTAKITLKIGDKQVSWDGISKIGDIVLLKNADAPSSSGGRCHACGYQNEAGSGFCAECGTKL